MYIFNDLLIVEFSWIKLNDWSRHEDKRGRNSKMRERERERER